MLAPGGLAAIGAWGGRDDERTNEQDIDTGRPPRLFSHRSDRRWRSMLERVGVLETFESWDDGSDWTYQWSVVRRASGS